MKSSRVWVVTAVLLVAPVMTSCWPFRKSRKPAPPPPIPQTQPAQTQPQPTITTPPPELPPASQGPVSPPPAQLPQTPTPSAPPPPEKRPSPAGPPVRPAPQPPSPETPAAPAPQLRPILTTQQKQQLNQVIDERIRRARRVLAAVEWRSLTEDQKAAVNQVRTFIQQAEDARKDDLVRAGNLAERADVLAQDLTNRIR